MAVVSLGLLALGLHARARLATLIAAVLTLAPIVAFAPISAIVVTIAVVVAVTEAVLLVSAATLETLAFVARLVVVAHLRLGLRLMLVRLHIAIVTVVVTEVVAGYVVELAGHPAVHHVAAALADLLVAEGHYDAIVMLRML